jgi:small GTP-binding protein
MSKAKIKEILTKDLLERFRKNKIPDEMISALEEKIAELGKYTPTVGIFGKTGVGKSSLCNALFGKDTAKVSDVHACTREPQEIFVQISESGSGIKLIDLPGVGESQVRDEEYKKLYENWIPKLDLIIWVIRADDRTFSVDEYFYENVVQTNINKFNTPFVVVVNQVDKINPVRQWDELNCRPGYDQQRVVGERTSWAASKFNIDPSNIVPVSAHEKYNMGLLVETIIDVVPNEKKLGFLNQIEEDVVSEKAKESAWQGVLNKLQSVYTEIKPYIPEIIEGIKWLYNTVKKKN